MAEKQGYRISNTINHLKEQINDDGIRFIDFIELIGDHGILLATIILVAPFLLPVSIPGSSLPFGLAIILLNLRPLLGGRIFLPDFVLNYRISQQNMISLLNGMERILSGLGRFFKPRLNFMENRSIKIINNCLIILSAFWLMLPLPIPLTDFLPAYSILFLAIGTVEKDGYISILGYILTAVTSGYFILIALVGVEIANYIFTYLGLNFRV